MYLHNRAPPEDNVSPVPTEWRGATELYHVQDRKHIKTNF